MVSKKRKARKGFNRSAKQWEESIAEHIGKIVDNMTVAQLIELLTYGVAAYYGQEAVRKQGVEDWEARAGGSALAIISLKLATGGNLAAGTAGVVGLGGIGLCAAVPDIAGALDPRSVWDDAMKRLSPAYEVLKQVRLGIPGVR